MALLRVLTLLCLSFLEASAHTAFRSTKPRILATDVGSYSFTSFMQDYGRSYAADTKAYHERARLFQESLERILAANAKNAAESRSWVAGTHEFMDWTPQELQVLQGYKPARARKAMVGLQTEATGTTASELNTSAIYNQDYIGEGAQHRNQGNCGSCWAVSAVEAVEAQLRRSGRNERVSAQALVDCVPNPHHCGGSGGCEGATGELAYAFMQQYGIPLESDLPYRKSGSFGPSQDAAVCRMRSGAASYPAKRRVIVDGWESKPTNRADGLMQALMQEGSAVVAVDAIGWFDYSSGVYDSCSKDATLGHAVLAKGYGRDTKSGKKFWLIQNSWGTTWGERGDIRLLRHDTDDEWCGTDSAPQKGVGCDDGPPTVDVCGMCGVLYDPLVPKGVKIVDDDEVGSLARVSKGDYTPWRPGQ